MTDVTGLNRNDRSDKAVLENMMMAVPAGNMSATLRLDRNWLNDAQVSMATVTRVIAITAVTSCTVRYGCAVNAFDGRKGAVLAR